MIKLNLKKYVDSSKISINALSKATGISRPTLTNMFAGKATGIQFETLDALCTFFNIGISDILQREISINDFNYIEMSGNKIDLNKHKIVGIQYTRKIKEKTDLEVAIFIISYDKKTSDAFNNQRSIKKDYAKGHLNIENDTNLSKSEKEWLEKTNKRLEKANNPKRLYFSLEWVIPQELDSLKPNVNDEIITDLKKANMLMNYGETVALYRSLPKEILSEISYRILVDFISNSDLVLDKDDQYIISVEWNLGTESSMNTQKYSFEFSVANNTFISLDAENDGISQQLEFEHTKLSPEIKKILYPNLSDLH